jgi:hypothetical protein
MLKNIPELPPIEHHIDIAEGIEKAGLDVDALKTHGVQITYHSTPVATIRTRPGDMAIRAHDLQAILATRYGWEYYEAMVLDETGKNKNASA